MCVRARVDLEEELQQVPSRALAHPSWFSSSLGPEEGLFHPLLHDWRDYRTAHSGIAEEEERYGRPPVGGEVRRKPVGMKTGAYLRACYCSESVHRRNRLTVSDFRFLLGLGRRGGSN